MEKKKIVIVSIISAAAILLTWAWIESTKPLPGQQQTYDCSKFLDFSKLENTDISDKCRAHLPSGQEVNYSTNPPVFGPHDSDWIKSGVYDEVKEDSKLIHSLEHGYVIVSYNCGSQIPTATASAQASLSAQFKTDDCKKTAAMLSQIYENKGKKKLIVVPRPILDSKIALTAWGWIDKFSDLDRKRIEVFIDAHLDRGPEKTME